MKQLNFLSTLHNQTKRDYVGRVVEHDKAHCAEIASQWGYDYWDGDRRYGYGGYRYDGRWRPVAQKMADHYKLKAGEKVLDIGCGKAFLLYELTQVVPGLEVCGVDISHYGIEHAKPEILPCLKLANATDLPFADDTFDFIYSLNVFHNLKNYELDAAINEMQRVAKRGANKYICVESFRNEQEKVNLLYWQLTCRSFYATDEWQWLMQSKNYNGDLGFIFFE